MSRNVEINFKVKGSSAELDKILNGLRGMGAEATKATPAVNDLEKKIQSLEKQLKGTKETTDKVGDSFEGFSARVRANLSNPFQSASTSVTAYLERMGKVPAIIAGVTVGLALMAKQAFELVEAQGAAAEQITNFADRVGISVKQAAQLQAAAKIANVDIGVLEGSTRLLAAALEDSSGAGAKAAKALHALEVSAYDGKGAQREMGAVLLDVLTALSKVEKGSERVVIAQQILGRGAKELTPLLLNLTELKRTVEELGVGLDENLIRNLAAADDEIDKMSIAWDLFKQKLAGKIAPIIIPFIQTLNGNPLGLNAQEAEFARKQGFFGDEGSFGDQQKSDREGATKAFKAPKSVFDTSLIQTEPAEAKKLSDAFKGSLGQTEDGLKKRLELVKKDAADLAAALASGDITDPKAFKSKKAEYDALFSEQKSIEASIKRAQELPALLKKLVEAEGSAVVGASDSFTKKLTDIRQKAQELADSLGPAYFERVNTLFQSQVSNASQEVFQNAAKQTDAARQKFIDAERKSQEDGRNALQVHDKEFNDYQRQRADDLKQGLQYFNSALKIFDTADQSRLTRTAEAQIRSNELTASPGQERNVEAQNLNIRLTLTQKLYDLEEERIKRALDAAHTEAEYDQLRLDHLSNVAKKEEDTANARIGYELKIAELRKKTIDDYRESAGRVFDSLKTKGFAGIKDFADGLLTQQARALFQNVSTGIFAGAGSSLGQLGAKSGLGGLLKGTLFDPANAPTSPTSPTENLSKMKFTADGALRVSVGGGEGSGGSGGGLVGGIASALGFDLPGFNGTENPTFSTTATGKKPGGIGGFLKNFGTGASGVLSGGLFSGLHSGDWNVNTGPGQAASASSKGLTSAGARIGNVAASAGAVVAGTMGVISGIQEGGARGALGAAGSALGVASLIPGPQQPFLMAASLITGIIKGFLPDPKAEREKSINEMLNNSRYKGLDPMNMTTDSYGREVDSDFRGRTRILDSKPRVSLQDQTDPDGFTYKQRSVTSQPIIHVTVPVTAFDSKSIIDHAPAIADAMGKAIVDGHRIMGDIMKKVKPF